MPRQIKVAAAQMGPNNEGVSREEIVERMLVLPQHYGILLQPVTEKESHR